MRSLCVFCGSSPGARPEYTATARLLGASLARRAVRLVYGGARVGLMRELADRGAIFGARVMKFDWLFWEIAARAGFGGREASDYQRELIVVSYAVADREYAESEAGFLLNPNRFNVAVTRARQTLDPQGLAWVDAWL